MNETALSRTTPVKKVQSPAHRGNGTSAGLAAGHALTEDATDARSQLILVAMLGFRDGDFSVRLPLGWSGMEGRIAEAFNQTIMKKQLINAEIARISKTEVKKGV